MTMLVAKAVLASFLAAAPVLVTQTVEDSIEASGPPRKNHQLAKAARFGGTADYAFDLTEDCKIALVPLWANVNEPVMLILGRIDSSLRLLDAKTIYRAPANKLLTNPRFSPDGSFVAIVEGGQSEEGRVIVLDAGSGKELLVSVGRAVSWIDNATLVTYTASGVDRKVCYDVFHFGFDRERMLVSQGCGGKNLLFPASGATRGDLPIFVPDGAKETMLLSQNALIKTGSKVSICPRPVACQAGVTAWSKAGKPVSMLPNAEGWIVEPGDVCASDPLVRRAAAAISTDVTSIIKAQECRPSDGNE